MKKYEKISLRHSFEGQNSYATEIGVLNGHKVRFRIRTDSYAPQRYGIAEIWSPTDLRWNTVAWLEASEFHVDQSIGYKRDPDPGEFNNDLAELQRRAEEVLC